MARPITYDDQELLSIMAERIVKGVATGTTTAASQAIDLIIDSNTWSLEKRLQFIERLEKKYRECKDILENDIKREGADIDS